MIEDAPANSSGAAVAGTGDDSDTVVVKKKKKVLINRDGRKRDMRSYIKAYMERRVKREQLKKKEDLRKRMGL